MNLLRPDKREHPLASMTSSISPKRGRQLWDFGFRYVCIVVTAMSIVTLAVLLGSVFYLGYDGLNLNFLTHYPEGEAALAGLAPALWGTIWVCVVCALVALPIGVATAIFLEEFKPRNAWLARGHGFFQLNISTLAGVPSVVYGILGLTLFVSMGGLLGSTHQPLMEVGVEYFDQFLSAGKQTLLIPIKDLAQPPTVVTPGMKAMTVDGQWVEVFVAASRRKLPKDAQSLQYALIEGRQAGRITKPTFYHFRLPLGRSVLAGALTLMLVILPIVIIASQEALRGVPRSLREAGAGLGATPWQVVQRITLPAAMPGIMTGAILAISRAIGEAAPILILAGAVFITSSPGSLMDEFSVLPLQIYNWAQRPQQEFHSLAASGIIVLLCILFVFNCSAVLIRQFAYKKHV